MNHIHISYMHAYMHTYINKQASELRSAFDNATSFLICLYSVSAKFCRLHFFMPLSKVVTEIFPSQLGPFFFNCCQPSQLDWEIDITFVFICFFGYHFPKQSRIKCKYKKDLWCQNIWHSIVIVNEKLSEFFKQKYI